ncbi:HesA/MoeB/ThiF family protein [Flagellimonas allohymeniacidonis]|uniref:Molybdopterin-synthase adenylyltransferase n=1 Tax=Flagellimonas allohymeniacidonis TaxID=2517819 RepID=A0A4Q8QGX9_9FLAO|nr:HesA/MoeB/ThiF family protein [Allomuricauda hymeniacidonis]TAI49815.1 sulfurtransferase [Allomuricauda hymeniacidonis]
MANRYIRQTNLQDFGEEGQKRLAHARVLVVGLGGLGIPVVQYLNAMGVGTLGLVDHDTVDIHNLQRQVLYSEADSGQSKLGVALKKLRNQNSETNLIPHDTFLTNKNALEIIKEYDVVVDATDNFPTRYLINDACIILNKPFVYGALHAFEGHVSVFNYRQGPTYRCLYPAMPAGNEVPNCDENGVLGVVPGIIGSLQALEVVKIITGIGEVLSGQLLIFNGLQQDHIKISFNSKSENRKIKALQPSYESLDCELAPSISNEEFLKIRASQDSLSIIDVRTVREFENSHLEEAHNIPLNTLALPADLFLENKPIYVICQSGKRSEKAVIELTKVYPKHTFYNILGGMNQMRTQTS